MVSVNISFNGFYSQKKRTISTISCFSNTVNVYCNYVRYILVKKVSETCLNGIIAIVDPAIRKICFNMHLFYVALVS